jgi:copper resistance protein B
LRYEFRREVAPYVGLVRERLVGSTADLARADGLDPEDTSLVAGIRLRF